MSCVSVQAGMDSPFGSQGFPHAAHKECQAAQAFSGTVMDSNRGRPCLFTFSPGVFRYCDGGNKFNQVTRVNGRSNYDSLKVLYCQAAQAFSGTVMGERNSTKWRG